MNDKPLISFDFQEQGPGSPEPVGGERLPSLTLDLDDLFSEHLSTSGSFDVSSQIWATTFGKLTQALPIPVLLVNSDHEIVVANQAWARISLDYRKLPGMSFRNLFRNPVAVRQAQASLQGVFSTRRPSEIESLLEINDKRIWARMNLRAIKIRGRRFVLVVCENLSAERLRLVLERRLRDHIEKAKQEWEQTFDSIPDLILILDKDRRILRANRPMADMLGMSVQDLVGKHCYQYMHGTAGPPDICPLKDVGDHEKTYCGEITFENLKGDYEVTLSPIIAKNGVLEGIVHVCRDVTVRKQVERERQRLLSDLIRIREDLAYRVSHDSLTGLLNRPAILGVLEKGLDRSARENTPLGVILADVDHFKRVNDEHGHLAGDAVLQAVAGRIKTSMRSYDSVGRYGGEEFIVVVPGCDMSRLQDMAGRLRARFDGKPIRTPEGEFDITLSIGVFLVQGSHSTNVNSVIRNVDTALYRAKDLGRNRVEFMT